MFSFFDSTRCKQSTRFFGSSLVATLFSLVGISADAGTVSWTNYSVVTIGTATVSNPTGGNLSTNSEITGNAFVSGNVVGNGFTMASDLPTVTNPATNPGYALTVVGNLNFSNNGNINNGYSVQYGGTDVSGNFNFNGGGSLTHSSSLASMQQTLTNQINTAASDFSQMTANGTVSGPASGTVLLNYTGSASGVAVFNLSAATILNGSAQRLDLELLNGASSVVINVTGLTAGFSFPNTLGWSGLFTDALASKIIWNFEGLTGTLTTNNQFIGSILAPGATLSNQNYVDGSVFVNTYTGNGEIHYKDGGYVVQYNGIDPTAAVPEPGSLALLATAGALAIVPVARRRGRKQA